MGVAKRFFEIRTTQVLAPDGVTQVPIGIKCLIYYVPAAYLPPKVPTDGLDVVSK